MKHQLKLALISCLVFVMGCSKPSEDKMEQNLMGETWFIEYFDVYSKGTWNDENSNGDLELHYTSVGQIRFDSDHTGLITDSAYSQVFGWRISDGYLVLDLDPSAISNDAHPLVEYAFAGQTRPCDDDIRSYSVLRSEKDIHIFRYRVAGACNLETFHCIEFAITR